ncbi:MAG: 2-C-methyl-D-erythritol 4-phosphate cytidylyltransferase [Candidatus Abyssobacteria bacterium SURF_5]|uniref:2-C-methyl-D-erythritol 4-phosphate cytidylyltransferase n=1 Tax=Abyssobacteria bacterium (strain SURF_5) TaxID=2093360 RepID=A0A3A4PCJ6_ABYX5|nr:MAG: 2-C-methyl-D-erythritol 4-phosphate cytidylyltransferase [Candidatus Abyssubacteria bacterium SURF_5]
MNPLKAPSAQQTAASPDASEATLYFRAAAIVPAAGQGIRMRLGKPKALLPLLGRPMLGWTLDPIQQVGLFSSILVACPPGEETAFHDSLAPVFGSVRFVAGGRTRQESVQNCLEQIPVDYDLVAIHDGARPLVTRALLRDTLTKAAQVGAAVAAVRSKDTVKECNERGVIERTFVRENLRLVQTPQCFRLELILQAYEKARFDLFSATDDSAIVERLGVDVHVVEGSYENIKVTTPEDIIVCEELLRRR